MRDTADLRIEFPARGAEYDRPEYGVYEYGVYEDSSVLAGQERRRSRGSFTTLAEAQKAYPAAVWEGDGSGYREVHVPHTPPDWFDEANAGERWDDDY